MFCLKNIYIYVKFVRRTFCCNNRRVSSVWYFFRLLLWRRRKIMALPLPVAILDALISAFANEVIKDDYLVAEGPPSCATTTIWVKKSISCLEWRNFRRRHLGWCHPRWHRRKWRLFCGLVNLDQWISSLLMHICVTPHPWVNYRSTLFSFI